jgi:kynurenine 3-monooxygenase
VSKHVVIVGAGLAGSLLAVYMARAGWRVTVFERRGDPRARGYVGGRSINLALSARGLAGLAGVGLDRVVMEHDAIAMPGRMIHAVDGALTYQPYSSNPRDAINSVSRGGLNLTLIRAAAACEGVSMHFDSPCLDVYLDAPAAVFASQSGHTVRVEADLIVGTDGAFSAVRNRLMKTDRFDYSQTYLEHGYKELMIPSAKTLGMDEQRFGGFAIDPAALHIWPRGSAMMIALPNRDHTFTCTLFWPFESAGGTVGLHALRSADDIRGHFEKHYNDAAKIMPTLVEDYQRNPSSSLVTVRCYPWQHGGKVALLGDACHAVVPFYGQGMNCAFEDCVCLDRCLREHPSDQMAALDAYQRERKPNADAIAQMALDNFIEMRDKVGRAEFLYKKKVEQTLHAALPERVHPQYNLVSFSTVPYAQALKSGRELDAKLERVIAQVPASELEKLGKEAWAKRVVKTFVAQSAS